MLKIAITAITFALPALSQYATVLQVDEAFVRETLALSPSSATAQGYHEHNGVSLDDQLDDASPEGVRVAHELYERFLQQSAQFLKTRLNDEEKADIEVIRLQCQYQLLELDKIQSYRHNPASYVELVGNAIYSPLVLQYAPKSKRFAQITSRLEKIPAFVESAKRNLVSAPDIWNRVAQQENQGDVELIDQTVRAQVPPELKTRYDAAAKQAIQSLRSFNDFLKSDLSRRVSDWRLGTNLYREKWELSLATGDTPERTLHDAELKLESIRNDMRGQATELYPKLFPGEKPPEGPDAVTVKVLGKITQRHTTAAGYFDAAKRDLEEATQFVRDKRLLALPRESNLEVIPTPEFMRGIYGVGGFAPAPALEPRLGSFYWITPMTPDMSADRVESTLREYNLEGLKILTVHEAMPGHYVQFEYASKVEPKWRGALREIYSNNPYVEGWAVYATELMISEGYQKTPEMRLAFGKQMLRVVLNTILDIRLQTMGMSDEEAMRLMLGTFQEKEEAQRKLQRAKLSSCQLPTYFVGWRGWDRLRADSKKKLGSGFRLSEFHEHALREGSVPLAVLGKMLLQ